jgi:hypothetical protein
MRVLLSGTSNAIIARGLNYPLGRDPRVTSFTNRSYGASGTVALADHLRNIDFSQYDFCVLDYCVNEEVFISINESTSDSAMNSLFSAIDAASLAGCQPLVVILPTSTRLNYPRPFENGIMDELATRSVPVFNFYTVAHQFAAHTGLTFHDMFLDPMHIHRELGSVIGTALINYMAERIETPPTLTTLDRTYDPLDFVPYTEFQVNGEVTAVTRESSLLTRDCFAISPNAQITVTAPSAGKITGISFDASRSVGDIKTQDATQTCLSLKPSSSFFRKTPNLTQMVLPVPQPITLDKNNSSTLHYSFDGPLTDIHPSAAMTLSGISIRHTDCARPVHILPRDEKPCSLADWLPQDHWNAIARQLQDLPRK